MHDCFSECAAVRDGADSTAATPRASTAKDREDGGVRKAAFDGESLMLMETFWLFRIKAA